MKLTSHFAFLAVSFTSLTWASAAAATVTTVIHPSFSPSICLTAANSNNAPVAIQPCVPNASNQTWVIGNGVVSIGDKCLDVPNGNKVNGQKLQVYKCFSGNTNQKWTVTPRANSNTNEFKLTGTSKCMDLTDGNRNNGTIVSLIEHGNRALEGST